MQEGYCLPGCSWLRALLRFFLVLSRNRGTAEIWTANERHEHFFVDTGAIEDVIIIIIDNPWRVNQIEELTAVVKIT